MIDKFIDGRAKECGKEERKGERKREQSRERERERARRARARERERARLLSERGGGEGGARVEREREREKEKERERGAHTNRHLLLDDNLLKPSRHSHSDICCRRVCVCVCVSHGEFACVLRDPLNILLHTSLTVSQPNCL